MIKRRNFLRLAGLSAVGFAVPRAAFAAAVSRKAAAARKPNVLFIAIDDLNHWVGYLGRNAQTKTPNIDRLASRGVWFTRSYCAAPVCNPSRAALMSGLRPFTTGVYENGNDWRTVVPPDLPLTASFRKAGYRVCGCGKIYHAGYKRREEWDDYLDDEGSDPGPRGDPGVGGIKFGRTVARDEDMRDYRIVNYGIEQLRKKHDKPFFLAVGLHKPHMPWYVPDKYFDMHPLDAIELPPHKDDDLSDIPEFGVRLALRSGDHKAIVESGRWREAVQAYLATITFCDAMVGRLLDAFDKSDYRDNTIVCFWSDHGWHLGEKQHWRKFALWEEATRAPFIWVVPGLTRPNARCDRTVDFMSIYPTLTDLCGIPIPPHVEGRSIRPLLADPSSPWEQPAVTTYTYKCHAVRAEGWRYIRYADGGEELYDETADPYEWNNLAGKPEYARTKADLTKCLPDHDQPDIGPAGAAGGKKRDREEPRKKNKKNRNRN